MALVIERLEGGEGWVKSEEAIEIENLILRDGDAGTHGVVVFFLVGHDNVEAVGGAALEDYYEAAAGVGGGSFSHEGADEEAGNGRGARDGQGAFVEEESPVDLHGGLLFFCVLLAANRISALPMLGSCYPPLATEKSHKDGARNFCCEF